MTLDEKLRAAVRLNGDPLFGALMEELQLDAYREWHSSAPGADDVRTAAYHKHTAITQLMMEVKNLAAQGARK